MSSNEKIKTAIKDHVPDYFVVAAYRKAHCVLLFYGAQKLSGSCEPPCKTSRELYNKKILPIKNF